MAIAKYAFSKMSWCIKGHQQIGTYITHNCSQDISIKYILLIAQWAQHICNQFYIQ